MATKDIPMGCCCCCCWDICSYFYLLAVTSHRWRPMTSRKSRGGDWDGWTRGSFVIFGWELSGCATKTYENIWGSLRKSVKWWIWDHLERTWLKFVMNVWPGSQGGKTGETHGCQWLLQTSQAWQSERSYGFVENPTPKHLNWFKCNILSPCPQYRKGISPPPFPVVLK